MHPKANPEKTPHENTLGALPTQEGTLFRIWSTRADTAGVVLYDGRGEADRRPLEPKGNGVFEALFPDVKVGDKYKFEVDAQIYPDPYARLLPEGVHGPAEVWDSSFEFRHETPKLKLEELVIYELHVGTFTKEGTYRAAQDKLPYLRDLGVNCVELLPISAFPGKRGWGYDGVAHFAPYREYGPPEELQAFIDAAHGLGFVVLLDVVYNHFGPDGNSLPGFSPEYFTHRHKTPWGDALDYENPFMRHLILDSAEFWLRTYRFDGFRLDATQSIQDDSDLHILEELAGRVHALGGGHFLFCEDYRNLPHLVTQFHMDGIWVDDFHHSVRVCLTGEQDGHFAMYQPQVSELARCIRRGWLYEGQKEWTLEPGFMRGESADDLAARNMVYFIQNHDQIGNRGLGDRLQETAGEDGFLAASVLYLFLPTLPLIFQGQEWMASTRFQFFSDHHGELGQLVSKGRLEEFGHFDAFKDESLRAQLPDPQALETFENSKLNWDEVGEGIHARTLDLYKTLLRMRRENPVLKHSSRSDMEVGCEGEVLWVRRWHAGEQALLFVNFGKEGVKVPEVGGADKLSPVLSTAQAPQGQLAPRSAVILRGARS